MSVMYCKIENCQIIYTEYQCKNCPNQVFDDNNSTVTTCYNDYRETTALKPMMGAKLKERDYHGKNKN